ncbi:MAG TPA: 30S ribosomal protein S2 [Patescibacteria group bacterium]|nr:30S ribosomal protein S2 [Patescibacteria group bacterium]
MNLPTVLEMLKAGVHFGHQASRRHPKMDPFIFTKRNGVHIIDLEKTKEKLEATLAAVKKMAAEGKVILFVTTKPQAKEIVKEAAQNCGMPYLVDRWLGGLLTNFSEIKRLIDKYNRLKEEKATGELEKYTKKEQLQFTRELEKMEEKLAGLSNLSKLPDVVFIPALQREKTALEEAKKMKIAIVGVTDTNANPDDTDHFIPANDDAVNAIKMIVGLVGEAIKEGKAEQVKIAGQEKK